ncbi:MAG: hypothetical protein AAFX85_07830 [Pseudomonadota bacterium]
MDEDDVQIRYRFRLPRHGGGEVDITLHFDPEHFEMRLPATAAPPSWTDLSFNQCPNCPLQASEVPTCPAAARLATIVPEFEQVVSFDELHLRVETPERRIVAETSVQQALSSLIGLVMATSGCPRTRFFRLMARYHLPLATEEETTLRVLGTYALQSLSRGGESTDLAPLVDLYRELRLVNQAMTRRLGAAGRTDSALNAVVILDIFALAVPAAIEEAFEPFRALLDPAQ